MNNRIDEEGWIRIGIIDSTQRRSMWMRLTYAPGGSLYTYSEVIRIELCSGREGNDDYVSFEKADCHADIWWRLTDTFSTMRWIDELNSDTLDRDTYASGRERPSNRRDTKP